MPHGADIFLLELFAIFVWAKVFGEIFEQISLPGVLGEILAGVVLGPHATGLVTPTETVGSIAEIGAIFLLFTVGLETRPSDLIKVGRKALNVAMAGIAVPFILGFGFLALKGEPRHEAVFVAAAMVATSVGITARVMSDMHVLHTHVARIILGAAVFDDILGMVLLTIVSGMAMGARLQWLHIGVLVAEAVGFAIFMIFIGPRIVRRMRPGLDRMSTHDAPLILALAICLGLSVLSTRIGMAAIIGAFFAGLVFADYDHEWKISPRAHGINEFLAPFFFFVMGSRLDITVFDSKVLVTAVIITILAIISKVVGCGLPMIRESWQEALQVGVGMTPRGEVALIVALIGLQMNAISQQAYAVVIFMAGFTTILAPIGLRYLFRHSGTLEPSSEEVEVSRSPLG
ncbi:MAG TPA: cation:proton antiporter [Terriglobales bacterium]|jgi:Kef-type K+ transport system membrane component KefB|nr:cation:proton antiporter [Terriglobales bacterium]